MRKRRKGNFRFIFFIYICVLIVAAAAALIYVNSALREYERVHPHRLVDEAVESLREAAADGSLWNVEGCPDMVGGVYEQEKDIKAEFVKLINSDVTYSASTQLNETDCRYGIKADGHEIAEVILRAVGEPKQKLAIINTQDYEILSYRPIVHNYTVSVPSFVKIGEEISFTFNGLPLGADLFVHDSAKGTLTCAVDGIYLKPELSVTDAYGNLATVTLPDKADGDIEFDSTLYDMTLPNTLTVTLDGEKLEGAVNEDGRITYSIRLAKKSSVVISDLYGNTVQYNGGVNIPITYTTIMANDGYSVKVDGAEVPEVAIEVTVNPDFKTFAELVPDLTEKPIYYIVVLKDNAKITVTDAAGNNVEIDTKEKFIDISAASESEKYDTVPEEVAAEIDVLKVLKNWSLFMSNDLDFYSLSLDMIPDSYQYNVAYAYNNSIDKTFTSIHTLLDPPFTDESVNNFVQITDNCFSVDISFVKHMYLSSGSALDDSMNERCYFVRYDTTDDYIDNPTWKLVGMKEIVDDGQ